MSHQPTFTTERLLLRPFTLADARDVQRLANSMAVARYMLNMPHPYLDGMAESWIGGHAAFFAAGKGIECAITLRDSGELCGAIGMFVQEAERASFGYWLGEEFWGKGYASEAANAIIDFGFEHFKLNRIYAIHYVGNEASGRVMQKVGMKYEGTLRQHFKRWDRYFDAVYYGIIREEWR